MSLAQILICNPEDNPLIPSCDKSIPEFQLLGLIELMKLDVTKPTNHLGPRTDTRSFLFQIL
ncbi:MAG: hypothetical protein AAB951_01020, partial [Patescibacteria group bacterium]